MASARKTASMAGSKTRVQGVTGDQTVKATAGLLHGIVVANADAAAQTLTIKDGATTLIGIRVPAGTTLPLDLGFSMATSIVVSPSDADLDALVIYD